jgi:hypothetical protein
MYVLTDKKIQDKSYLLIVDKQFCDSGDDVDRHPVSER